MTTKQLSIGKLLTLKSGEFLSAANMDANGQYPVYGGNGINGYHSAYLFEERKIVIGRVGVYCGAIEYTLPYSWITDNALYVAEKGPGLLDDYLVFALRYANLNQYASRFGQPLISQSRIQDVKILVPPLPEQQRIAAILDQADRLRRTRRYAAQLSDSFLQAVFIEMFGDRVRNANKWRVESLESICRLIRDGTHQTPTYVSSGIPFVTVKNITSGSIDFSDTKFISEKDHALLSKTVKPERNDILVSKDGTIGVPCVVDTDKTFSIFVSVALLKLRPELVNTIFLAQQIRSDAVQNQIKDSIKGIAIRHLHLEDFARLRIILPPLVLQEKFARIVQQFDRLRAQQREAERQAEQLFQALLHRAFTPT